MKHLHILVFIISLTIISSTARAQVPELIKDKTFQKDAQAAVDSLYNFNPEGAEKRLSSWKKKYPHHPLWKLIDGMEFWWTILSDLNDTSHDKQFFTMMEKADYAASKLLYKQPRQADALIIQTVANGYIARQYSNREEWVSSLNAARKAYQSFGEVQNVLSDLPDLKLANGLKLYYSAYLPEAYPVVKSISWFLPDGNKTEGLQDMRMASKKAIFARAEATYFLGNINLNYQKDYDRAVRYFKELYQRYPNNNYYVRLLVKSYYQTGRPQQALRVIDDALTRWKKKKLPFGQVLQESLNFWKGRILLLRGSQAKAASFLKKSYQLGDHLPRTSHRPIHVAAAYYLGVTLQARGQNQGAVPYFKAVLHAKAGDSYRETAQKHLQEIHDHS